MATVVESLSIFKILIILPKYRENYKEFPTPPRALNYRNISNNIHFMNFIWPLRGLKIKLVGAEHCR